MILDLGVREGAAKGRTPEPPPPPPPPPRGGRGSPRADPRPPPPPPCLARGSKVFVFENRRRSGLDLCFFIFGVVF